MRITDLSDVILMHGVPEWPDGDTPPETVIAPAHPVGSDGFELEARPTPDGGSFLPVFSTIGLLVEGLGRYQPWVALPVAQVREMAAGAGVGSVVLDPRIPAGVWEWTEDDIRMFNRLRSSDE